MPPYDPQLHHRRSIRLPGYDYSKTGAYFITLVTHGRECLFGDIIKQELHLTPTGELISREWDRLSQRFLHVRLDSFVIMPNHVHGIFVIADDRRGTAEPGDPLIPSSSRRAPTSENFGKPVSGSLPTIIRSYKSATTLRINYLRGTPGTPVWQRNYYEHIIRDEPEMDAIRQYIQNNPAQWELDLENPNRTRAAQ